MSGLANSLEKTKRSGDRPQSVSSRLSLLLYHEGAPRVLQLVRGVPLVVGRKPPSDVVIEDPELSRQHARFVWEGAGVRIQDLGSTNGTFSGGERISDALLSVGDEVLLGSVTACVHAPTAALSMAPPPEVVISSPAMKELHEEAMRVAGADIGVLLTGETGVGKDVLARLIHKSSTRAEQPMLAINCGAVTSSLIQSQLFGHERGAFTGAERRVAGIFEQADGGTVFLDEVGELPMEAQVSLLRVLETGTFTRVGSQQELRVDVRVLSATSRDLPRMCESGSFRTDLLYRLNTVHFTIPPLRMRREEIPVLAMHFLTLAQKKHRTSITGFHADAMHALRRAAWPGNIRELRNVVERAAIMTRGTQIELSDIAGSLRDEPASSKAPLIDSDLKLKDQVRRYEAELILEALRDANWNQTEAARRLEIPIRTLAHKIQKFDLKKHFPG